MWLRKGQKDSAQRVYAIGDVHGRFDLFRRLMLIVEEDNNTRPPAKTQVILLGDIIDRGPSSARMIKGCMALTTSMSRFIVLRGNHEDMMMTALRGDLYVFGHWLNFGGRETLISWGVDPGLLEEMPTMKILRHAASVVGDEVIDWLKTLPLYYKHNNYLFVHAGIKPGVPLRKQHSRDLLWISDEFLDSDASHGMTVVHGHTIVESGAVILPNRIGIDTGAYRTDRLTAIGIEGDDIWFLDTINHEKSADASSDVLLLDTPYQADVGVGRQAW